MGSFLLSLCSPLLVGVPLLGEAEERSGAGGSGERREGEDGEEVYVRVRNHIKKMGGDPRFCGKDRE